MLIFQIFIYAVGILAVVLTILPFFKHDAWWVRIGDFPRVQVAVLCVAVAISILFFFYPPNTSEIIFICLLLASAVYQLHRILPYLPVYPRQVERSRERNFDKRIRLLIANVYQENRDYERLLALVEKLNPDIVLLAETDEAWMKGVAKLDENYPHAVKHPLDNAYGIALFSQLPLIKPKLRFVVEDDIPSIHTGVRLRSGDVIDLYCLHPRPPVPPENDRSTERDAELIVVGRMIQDTDTPTIIAGDLNDVAWSYTTSLFQKISNLLDPRIGRGLYNSFHAGYPFIRFPLDHVFHSNHFRLVKLARLPHIGSDHFPIFIALSYEKTAHLTQEEPDATHEEEREADEMIEEAAQTLVEENRIKEARRLLRHMRFARWKLKFSLRKARR